MKRAPRSRQRHDLYAKYHDYDSEISDLLGECGLKTEAIGTRHASQIDRTIRQNGEGPMVSDIAAGMSADQCAFLLIAPDSTVRALAISMLPERNGQ